MIDLKPFCADKDDRRYFIREPISDSHYTYAMNGHVIVRVPRRQDYPETNFSPKCAKLFDQQGKPNEWFQIPEFELPPKIVCIECDGTGKHEERPCEDCDGKGYWEKFFTIPVGNASFQGKYLKLLAKLPVCEISPNGPGGAAQFRFDGGDGLLMACKA